MKKPTVDYSGFRLSRLREPQFCHLLFLLGWAGHFLLYALTEALIPAERCVPVHCMLDDLVPFCEWFVIPYVFWYALIAGSVVIFALYDVDSFKKLMTYIIITQVAAMAIYIFFPSRQDLRPEVFARNNLPAKVVQLLYTLDTNTNVCPSLHVAYSVGIASVWIRRKGTQVIWKVLITISAVLICLSTVFIKQHSVLDSMAAIPVCLLAEYLTYHFPKRKRG